MFVVIPTVPVQAGYIIFENTLCLDGSECVRSISPEDPNQEELYQILLDHSWPTAKHSDTLLSESDELSFVLESSAHLRGRYRYFWIPSTLEDLSCASALLRSKTLVLEPSTKKPIPADYLDGDFTIHTDGQFRNFLTHKDGRPLSEEVSRYFDEFNRRGMKSFFLCNSSLTENLYTTVVKDLALRGRDTGIPVSALHDLLFDKAQLKLLRASIAHQYAHAVRRLSLIQLPKNEMESDSDTLLDKIISYEIESNGRNETLIFRGTEGIDTLFEERTLDSSLSYKPLTSFGVGTYDRALVCEWRVLSS